MKTLEQIKDEVANELHKCTFKQAYLLVSVLKYDEIINEVVKRYAQQACEDLRERIAENATMNYHCGHFKTNTQTRYQQIGDSNVQVNREGILNTEIILP